MAILENIARKFCERGDILNRRFLVVLHCFSGLYLKRRAPTSISNLKNSYLTVSKSICISETTSRLSDGNGWPVPARIGERLFINSDLSGECLEHRSKTDDYWEGVGGGMMCRMIRRISAVQR
jgi:hypothetical protein